MFRVRKMELKDFPFAVNLANTMNWNMTAADFDFNAKLEPNGCFILQDDSKRIGLATCISYDVIGWFGNLVVKEADRKKGAGTALVNHAVNYLKSLGVKTVGLYAYQSLTDFYGKLGFKHDADFAVLKANKVSTLAENNVRLKTIETKDLIRIMDFDAGCFAASRKKLLKLVLQNPNNLCYLSTEKSGILGFIAAKVYEETAEIGPLVCQKEQPETALKLLKKVLHQVKGFEAYMYVPISETELLDTAFKSGFKEEFKVSRMFLGPAVPQQCLYIAESLERG